MNRRDFLKKAGAAVALAATGIEAKAMVPPYPWPGEPPREPVEGTECGALLKSEIYYDSSIRSHIVKLTTYNRALTEAEASAISANPWQLREQEPFNFMVKK